MAKRVIVHEDDVGMNRGANTAFLVLRATARRHAETRSSIYKTAWDWPHGIEAA